MSQKVTTVSRDTQGGTPKPRNNVTKCHKKSRPCHDTHPQAGENVTTMSKIFTAVPGGTLRPCPGGRKMSRHFITKITTVSQHKKNVTTTPKNVTDGRNMSQTCHKHDRKCHNQPERKCHDTPPQCHDMSQKSYAMPHKRHDTPKKCHGMSQEATIVSRHPP